MDTKPLESFAKSARRELLIAVEARVSTVLAVGSVARSERAVTVRLLESEIADRGSEHVIDRVAYTWFNRLIALRFMDARGYTAAGIVSPASGQAHGQPEILADAKRGNLDTTVVTNARAEGAIIGLLDGSRRSTDAEGEAYALLLTEYCRHWHKTMPFMFEAEGAYTELLVPSGLLADGALLARAREVLTEDVCVDVEVIGWLYQFYISERKDEVFAGFKNNKKAGADEIPAATQLFTPHWIVRYLLENSLGRLWTLNRPTSRLIDQMDYYIAPVDEETDFLKVSGPEELTVIDPACGSGHMLTYAFDLLYAIYDEEGYAPSEIPRLILTHNLHGTEIDPRAGALAAFALTMKARAQDRRYFTRSPVQPNICVIEPISFTPEELNLLTTTGGDHDAQKRFWNQFRDADVLGALIQPNADAPDEAARVLELLKDQEETFYYDTLLRARRAVAQAEILSRMYSVVTANPPYMGSKNMDVRLAEFAKEAFPDGKQDLYGCFVLRSMALAVPGGFVAKIIGDTWMSIASFKHFRKAILSGHSFDSFVHMRDVSNHPDIFGANAAFVLSMTNTPGKHAPFVRLTPLNEDSKRLHLLAAISNLDCEWRYAASAKDFGKIPGAPIAYWLSDAILAAFSCGSSLAEFVPTREGLTTGDNERFLRRWHEVGSSAAGDWATDSVASNRRWFPYVKGGDFRRWWGNHEYVVDWERDGERQRNNIDLATGRVRSHNYNGEFTFRSGFTWTGLSSGGFSGRLVPRGFMFDATAPMAFPLATNQIEGVLAILNSSTGAEFLKILAPTLHFKLGTVMSTPAPGRTTDSLLLDGINVKKLVNTSTSDWDDFETSWDFDEPSWLKSRRANAAENLEEIVAKWSTTLACIAREQAELEAENNRIVAEAYDLAHAVTIDVPLNRVSLARNVEFCYGPSKTAHEYKVLEREGLAAEMISYGVGCMFGRYSLDEPGLILADQAATLQDYLTKVVPTGSASDVTFMPDADNVIPFVDDGWFEDDVVERFREFLKVAFGTEHFEANLRFVEESLGVKTLRDYFIIKSGKSKFYDDHVKRYKKRPIYWMFSSPKGSFNALIYLHRYTPSTVSTVLNEYLREFENKLQKAFERAEEAAAGGTSAKDQKEADRLRKVLAELRDYEHDVLYPLATQQVEIDLDDGVKVNYPKFYPAVKKIIGLETSDG